MPISFLYWLLLVMWLLFGAWGYSVTPVTGRGPVIGFSLLIFALFVLIGLHDFGAPIR